MNTAAGTQLASGACIDVLSESAKRKHSNSDATQVQLENVVEIVHREPAANVSHKVALVADRARSGDLLGATRDERRSKHSLCIGAERMVQRQVMTNISYSLRS